MINPEEWNCRLSLYWPRSARLASDRQQLDENRRKPQTVAQLLLKLLQKIYLPANGIACQF